MGHDPGMKSRVHPKHKTQYRVSNWAEYDRVLVERGDITLWASTDATDAWKPAPSGRRGGQVLPLHGSTVQGDEVDQQGLDNELIEKPSRPVNVDSAVDCRERLGGILRYYHRRVA